MFVSASLGLTVRRALSAVVWSIEWQTEWKYYRLRHVSHNPAVQSDYLRPSAENKKKNKHNVNHCECWGTTVSQDNCTELIRAG